MVMTEVTCKGRWIWIPQSLVTRGWHVRSELSKVRERIHGKERLTLPALYFSLRERVRSLGLCRVGSEAGDRLPKQCGGRAVWTWHFTICY
jgi:hypothetical protein